LSIVMNASMVLGLVFSAAAAAMAATAIANGSRIRLCTRRE
jgi:hypothetical protein